MTSISELAEQARRPRKVLRSEAFPKLIKIREGVPYNIEDRPFMKQILDSRAEYETWKCGRQVGKTILTTDRIRLYDGSWKLAKDISLGDSLSALSHDKCSMVASDVTWVSPLYEKECLRITTRLGHVIHVAKTHPLRVWDGWVDAGEVSVKTRVATVRRAPGTFTSEANLPSERVRLTGYLLGDGGLTSGNVSFTSLPDAKLDEFKSDLDKIGVGYAVCSKKKTDALAVQVHKTGSILELWLEQDGLRWKKDENGRYGPNSFEKFIPAWVFQLSRKDTALFLNRLWSTDGSVKLRKNRYEISYASVSDQMIKDVQSLLWKFGIPSKIRKRWPSYHKKRGVEKYAYELRVETQDGVRVFLKDIGALTKSEGIPLPVSDSSNNRDTYPIEINRDIEEIIESRGNEDRYGCHADSGSSLRTAGLRQTLKYAPTKEKLQTYVDFFRADYRYDRYAVEKLASHLDTDVYWDEIVKIEDIGQQECIDYTVRDVHNFVIEGVITHNSVNLAGDTSMEGAIIPGLGQLYVAPRGEQAATFSRMVFSPMCKYSPHLKHLIPKGKDAVWQIGTREFTNGSYFYFRSAYLDPDSVRGLTAYRIKFDEFQDFISDHIGPIEECAGNAPPETRQFKRSGTPKTFQNLLERSWQDSSQCEWFIKCPACNYYNFQDVHLLEPERYACHKCKATLDSRLGVWVAGRNDRLGSHNGWRITQMMNPNVTPQILWKKLKDYPISQFFNECLGLSYSEGKLVLSEEDIVRACVPKRKMAQPYENPGMFLVAGIDWGTGGMGAARKRGQTQVSYTTVTIGGIKNGQFHVVYMKRFTGKDAELSVQPELVNRLLHQYRVKLVMSDWGFGAPLAAVLMNKFDWRYRNFFQVQEASQSSLIKWNAAAHRYILDRNEMFLKLIEDIKGGRVVFFEWDQMKDFATDFTTIFVELDAERRKMKFDHKDPDDCFHSTAYAYIGALKAAGALSRYDLTSMLM